MIWITHITFAVLIGLIMKAAGLYDNYGVLLSFAVGALFPDLDTPYSFASRLFLGKMRRVINPGYHRGFLHSIYAMLIVTGILSIATILIDPWFKAESFTYAIVPFMIGYSSHLILDMLTPAGIRPFYKHGPRIRGGIGTGSVYELLLLLVISAIALTIFAKDAGVIDIRTIENFLTYLAIGELFVTGLFEASTVGMRSRRKNGRGS